MIILGINAYHGDVSAVLLRDGELVAAVEEERFRRVKHWAGFPHEAIRVCLDMAGVQLFLGARVVRVHRHRGGITIRSVGTGPDNGVVRGRLLILATGAAYHLHRELELGIPDRFVQTAQVEADFADTAEVEVYFGNSVAPGSFAWVVPLRRNGQPRARIGLMTDKDADGHLLRFLQSKSIASRLGDGMLGRFRRRPIPLAPLARTFGERVLVVGDAAGLTSPPRVGGSTIAC